MASKDVDKATTSQPQPTMPNQEKVNAVSVKAPQFSPAYAEGFFKVFEAQFKLANVTTSSTKFFHIISALPAEIVDLIPNDIYATQNYDDLKVVILRLNQVSKPEMLNKLMDDTTITGKPSVTMREMRNLAKEIGVGDEVVRMKFLQKLPQNISGVLASHTNTELEILGRLADELMPYFAKSGQFINYLNQGESRRFPNEDRMQSTSRNNYSNYKTTNSQPIGLRPFNPEQKQKICRAHIFFAEKARTCKPWCKFPVKNRCKMLPSSRPVSRDNSPVRDRQTQQSQSNDRHAPLN